MPEVVASTSKDGGSFHEPECHFASRTTPENRVTLDSPDVAEGEGYQPCTFCFPERREAWFEKLRSSRRRSDTGRGPSGGRTPRDDTPEEDACERGVYHQGYRGPAGGEVLVAIDSRGRAVVRTFVPDHANRDSVVRRMRMLLSAIDPPGWQQHRRAVERRKGLELIH